MNATASNPAASAERASFQTLEDRSTPANADVNLDVILDVPVTLSMEVGRARIPIRNLLQLNQGSVVELERAAGEPLDVYANGTLIAHGEVVVVNEKFGIRLTDVVSPAERIRKLKRLLAAYSAQRDLIAIGAYQRGADPLVDEAMARWPAIQAFLGQDVHESASLADSKAALAKLLEGAP